MSFGLILYSFGRLLSRCMIGLMLPFYSQWPEHSILAYTYMLTELVQDFIIVLACRPPHWSTRTHTMGELDCDLLSDHRVPRMFKFINVISDLLSFWRSRRQVAYILVSELTYLRFLHQYHARGWNHLRVIPEYLFRFGSQRCASRRYGLSCESILTHTLSFHSVFNCF